MASMVVPSYGKPSWQQVQSSQNQGSAAPPSGGRRNGGGGTPDYEQFGTLGKTWGTPSPRSTPKPAPAAAPAPAAPPPMGGGGGMDMAMMGLQSALRDSGEGWRPDQGIGGAQTGLGERTSAQPLDVLRQIVGQRGRVY